MLIKLNNKCKCDIIKYQLCKKKVLTWKKEKQFFFFIQRRGESFKNGS